MEQSLDRRNIVVPGHASRLQQVGTIHEIWGQSQGGNGFGGAADIDTPNTTSSTTYTLKFKNTDATTNMSVPADTSDNCTMTLKEIMT